MLLVVYNQGWNLPCPNKGSHESSQWLLLCHISHLFRSTVRHYGPVTGIRVLNWMDLLCQYIDSYIPIISYRHNPRSVGFHLVSGLATKVKWNCHTVLARAIFYTYIELQKIRCWNQNTTNEHDLATSQTILQLSLTNLLWIVLYPSYVYLLVTEMLSIPFLMMLQWRTAFNGKTFINYRLLNIHWIQHSTHHSLEGILELI